MQTPTKSCLLDPILTHLLKEFIDLLLPVITNITNLSIISRTVPSSLKSAIIIPLAKKPDINCEDLRNYRPVSNIPFLDNIIERAQLQEYLEENNLENISQSTYMKHHSTETALLRVQNDILRAIDTKSEVAVVLLDLSAAFDTLKHKILLDRLKNMFGLNGAVLGWISSFFLIVKNVLSLERLPHKINP